MQERNPAIRLRGVDLRSPHTATINRMRGLLGEYGVVLAWRAVTVDAKYHKCWCTAFQNGRPCDAAPMQSNIGMESTKFMRPA